MTYTDKASYDWTPLCNKSRCIIYMYPSIHCIMYIYPSIHCILYIYPSIHWPWHHPTTRRHQSICPTPNAHKNRCPIRTYVSTYRVATISRLLTITGLFCKRALYMRLYSAKETYIFKEPTNRSHPISESISGICVMGWLRSVGSIKL